MIEATLIQLGWLGAEAILVSAALLLFYRLRARFGHAMLYVTLGALQYLQTVLATSSFSELFPGVHVSPGSAVLFSANLLVILLVYIREDLEEARRLIYSVVVANAFIGLISLAFGLHLSFSAPGDSAHAAGSLFSTARVLTIGTLVLYLDVILTIVLYEAISRVVRFTYVRIFATVACVLIFDTVLFTAGNFLGDPQFRALLISGIAGKVCAAVFGSAVMTAYLHGLEPHGGTLGTGTDTLSSLFKTLTYRQRFEQLREQLNRDGLTGVYNRAFFDEALAHQLALARRHGHPAALLMLDLDHFKQINDRDGHQAGDRALVAVARVLCDEVRESDLVCRYGGEEFAVICPHASLEQAHGIGDKLRRAVAAIDRDALELGQRLSATIGVAEYPRDADNHEDLIRRADRRLYRGKKLGRDRVVSGG